MKKLFILLILLITSCVPTHVFTPIMTGDCVDRVVAIRQELRVKGYEADIILGAMEINGVWKGHAWVQYKDKITGEIKRIDNY